MSVEEERMEGFSFSISTKKPQGSETSRLSFLGRSGRRGIRSQTPSRGKEGFIPYFMAGHCILNNIQSGVGFGEK